MHIKLKAYAHYPGAYRYITLVIYVSTFYPCLYRYCGACVRSHVTAAPDRAPEGERAVWAGGAVLAEPGAGGCLCVKLWGLCLCEVVCVCIYLSLFIKGVWVLV